MLPAPLCAQHIWVHFTHGSRPVAPYRGVEKKWHGGKWGGHVGVEVDSNVVIDFFPLSRRVHWVAHRRRPVGKFLLRSREGFWGYFGLPADSLERSSVRIPVTAQQQERLQTTARQWAERSPWDYAVFGMRCTSASYALLMEAGVVKRRSRWGVVASNFYPKLLRKKLVRRASREGWMVLHSRGGSRRIWAR